MTDKERIEVYVNKMPDNCYDCLFYGVDREQYPCYCLLSGEEVGDSDEKVSELRHSTCSLKTIQSVQNQKAVEALQKVRKIFMDATLFGDIVITKDVKYVAEQIDQLIEVYGGKE